MQITDPIVEAVDSSMVQELPRTHLGISQVGHPCERYLWLSFRWPVIEKFP